jgi:hypothetical protein
MALHSSSGPNLRRDGMIREFANVREKIFATAKKANGGGLFQHRRRGFAKPSVFWFAARPVKSPFV